MKQHDEDMKFIKDTLADRVTSLPEGSQRMFRLIYGRDNGRRSIEDAEKLPVHRVIDEIPYERLQWALTQVGNTIRKNLTIG